MVMLAHDDGPPPGGHDGRHERCPHASHLAARARPGPVGGRRAQTGRWRGLHGGVILLALLVLGGLGFGATRLRRGQATNQHDDQWIRPESPPAPPSSAPPPSRPPVRAARAVRPSGPAGPATISPARKPAAAVSFERPAGGWAVETHGLTKRFGSTAAVNDVELLVPRGSAFGYLGPNGAGKTTLIRTLLGLTQANGGTMSLLGIPVPAERQPGAGPGRGDRRRAPLPPAPDRPGQPAPAGRGPGRGRGPADRAVAGPSRPGRPRRGQGRRVLDGHAPAPRGGRLPARRPGTAHPGRADERARPGRACTRCGR